MPPKPPSWLLWTGHTAILGGRKNPLIPEVINLKSAATLNPKSEINLAERTIQDVLLHFGDTLKVAGRRYRQFVKNGIDQGKRPELQGGGLVRSAGGNKAGLLGRKKEERELCPMKRILGSGDFVGSILADSGEIEGYRYLRKVSLSELVLKISAYLDADKDEVLSGNRRRKNCHARDLVSFVASKSMGYKFNEIAEILDIYPARPPRRVPGGPQWEGVRKKEEI